MINAKECFWSKPNYDHPEERDQYRHPETTCERWCKMGHAAARCTSTRISLHPANVNPRTLDKTEIGRNTCRPGTGTQTCNANPHGEDAKTRGELQQRIDKLTRDRAVSRSSVEIQQRYHDRQQANNRDNTSHAVRETLRMLNPLTNCHMWSQEPMAT